MGIYVLTLLATFAAAMFGAYQALEKHFDPSGVVVCAAVCALGGGTVRDLVLGNLPSYFGDHTYLLFVVFGATAASALHKHTSRLRRPMLIIDAIGLASLAIVGAQKGEVAGTGLFGALFCAGVTAAVGGILTDIIAHERPKALTGDLYIVPAAGAGALHEVLLRAAWPGTAVTWICLILPFAVRVWWLARAGALAAPAPAAPAAEPGQAAADVPVAGAEAATGGARARPRGSHRREARPMRLWPRPPGRAATSAAVLLPRGDGERATTRPPRHRTAQPPPRQPQLVPRQRESGRDGRAADPLLPEAAHPVRRARAEAVNR